MGPPGGLQEFNFIVPTGKTGLIIGKGNISYIHVYLYVVKKTLSFSICTNSHTGEVFQEKPLQIVSCMVEQHNTAES